MQIETKRIGARGLTLSDSISTDDQYLLEDGSTFLEDIDYEVHFQRDGDRIKARGTVRTAVSLQCVRCLERFELKVDSGFDIILFPVSLLDSGSASLNQEEMEYIFFQGNKIDLAKILAEQVNLYVPMNPVCREDCLGICPNCGANLNHESCQCENTGSEMNLIFNKLKR